jgi:hypothetical protein
LLGGILGASYQRVGRTILEVPQYSRDTLNLGAATSEENREFVFRGEAGVLGSPFQVAYGSGSDEIALAPVKDLRKQLWGILRSKPRSVSTALCADVIPVAIDRDRVGLGCGHQGGYGCRLEYSVATDNRDELLLAFL